jgi:hypothetical protein
MDLKEKVTLALERGLGAEQVDLDDDDGISGYVVAEGFRGLESIDRQTMIEKALRSGPRKITKPEFRRVIAIAGLTPEEYLVYGAR